MQKKDKNAAKAERISPPRARRAQWEAFAVGHYLRGHTAEDVRRLTSLDTGGAKITKTFVSKAVNKAIERWKVEKNQMIDAHKAIELAKINNLEEAYWEGWRRSLRAQKTNSKKKTPGKTEDQKPQRLGVTEITNTERESAGDSKFLDGVDKCVARRCAILGLEAPVKINTDGKITIVRKVLFNVRAMMPNREQPAEINN